MKETQKITNAMYLIASTKLRKARNDLDNTRPYFYELRSEIKRIFRTVNDVDSPYFYPPDYDPADHVGGTYGCLVITADKGLAGAYNQNVIKEAKRLVDAHSDTKLFVVGEYGRRFFEQRNIPIERSFLYTAQNPTLERAREISSFLLEQYDSGALKKIFVVYTDMPNGMTMNARSTRLLPFHRTYFDTPASEKKVSVPFEFTPSVAAVLNVTEDHLNRHGTMENYIALKERVFANCREGDFVVLNYDNAVTRAMAAHTRAKVVWFSRSGSAFRPIGATG